MKDDWEALYANLARPAVHHNWRWYHALASHVLDEPLCFYCVYDRGLPVALFIFQLRRRFLLGSYVSLEFPCNKKFTYLSDALIRPEYTDRGLLAEVISVAGAEADRRWDVCRLKGFTGRSLLNHLIEVKVFSRPERNNSAYIRCADRNDLKRLSSKQMRNVRRLEKKLAGRNGDTELVIGTASEGDSAFREFLRIEDSGWKSSEGTSIMREGEHAVNFYAQLYHLFGESGDSAILLLRAGGRNIAAGFALRTGNCWSLFKIAYDERFAEFGPGNILLYLFIEQMVTDPEIDEVCLTTCPPWSTRWHMEQDRLNDYIVFAESRAAHLVNFSMTLRETLARTKRRLLQ